MRLIKIILEVGCKGNRLQKQPKKKKVQQRSKPKTPLSLTYASSYTTHSPEFPWSTTTAQHSPMPKCTYGKERTFWGGQSETWGKT